MCRAGENWKTQQVEGRGTCLPEVQPTARLPFWWFAWGLAWLGWAWNGFEPFLLTSTRFNNRDQPWPRSKLSGINNIARYLVHASGRLQRAHGFSRAPGRMGNMGPRPASLFLSHVNWPCRRGVQSLVRACRQLALLTLARGSLSGCLAVWLAWAGLGLRRAGLSRDWTGRTGLYWIGRAAKRVRVKRETGGGRGREEDVARHRPIILPPCRARQCSLSLSLSLLGTAAGCMG